MRCHTTRSQGCGEGGIRTLDTVTRIHAFQASSLSHSDTSPRNFWEPDANRFGSSGEAGIRTLDTREGIPVFETGPFDHSGTSPGGRDSMPAIVLHQRTTKETMFFRAQRRAEVCSSRLCGVGVGA